MKRLLSAVAQAARRTRAPVAGMLAVALLPCAAQAETTRLGGVYDVSVAGLKIARGSLSLVVQGGAYSAKVGMEPAGVGTLFSAGKGGAESSGWLRGDRVLPARYVMTSHAANRDFFVDLSLGGGRLKSAEVSPKFKPNRERIEVTSRHTRNVVDPLSAILMPVKTSRRKGDAAACDRKIPVFDGWTRYDIQLSYKETKEVSGRGYDGPVVVCSARWIPVAGHRPSTSAKYTQMNRNMEAWLTPLDDGRVFVPYRVQMGTSTGTLVVEARALKLSAGERDQAAAE